MRVALDIPNKIASHHGVVRNGSSAWPGYSSTGGRAILEKGSIDARRLMAPQGQPSRRAGFAKNVWVLGKKIMLQKTVGNLGEYGGSMAQEGPLSRERFSNVN
jgi:hypothetical protein